MTDSEQIRMSSGKKLLFITMTFAIVIGVGGTLLEGAYSLITGRSLVRRGSDTVGFARMRMTREERLRAAALTIGSYQRSLNPKIGMLLKGRFSSTFHDAVFHTDDNGQRVRTGPAIADGAQRIIILGDSVAFGYGVEDNQTFAEQLERQLSNANISGAPRAGVWTVACPGWNFENAYHYLLSHIDALDPDIVIWIPVSNDLDSSFSVTETGHRAVDHDPSASPTDTFCSLAKYYLIYAGLKATLPDGKVPGSNLHGSNFALISGVTPESARRYRKVERGLRDLQERLNARGCRLAICHPNEEVFQSRLAQILAGSGSKIPRFGLFGQPKPHLALDGDPHFNSDALAEGARRMAVFLAKREWVKKLDASKLSPPNSLFKNDIYPVRDTSALQTQQQNYDVAAAAMNGSLLDLTTGVGYHQIYGGLWHDGIMGRAALVALKNNGGQTLGLNFRRVAERPGLYPNTIDVSMNGQFLGSVLIPAGDEDEIVSATLTIPDSLRSASYLDVSFNPALTTTVIHRRVERLAGIKLLRAAVEK